MRHPVSTRRRFEQRDSAQGRPVTTRDTIGDARTDVLITVDVEIAHDRDLGAQDDALWRLHAAMRATRSTWFCTADAAERFAAPLRALARDGHTIGCHGLDHGAWEDYRRLDAVQARRSLVEATHRIEDAIGVRPRVFRGPRMTTSAAAQAALVELGYEADFSVCAWRWDAFAASAFDRHWLTCRPQPYRPAPDDPFARIGPGRDGELIVVPLSGVGLPLCSGTLFVMGHRATCVLAHAAARLGSNSRAPLVYLFHSYESCDVLPALDRRPRHHRLYPDNAQRRHEANLDFIRTLRDNFGMPVDAASYLPRTRTRHIHEPEPAQDLSGDPARPA